MKRLSLLGIVWLATTAATPVSVAELDSDPFSFDGTEVTIVGEIVGDHASTSDRVWIQVNDDAYVETPFGDAGELLGTNSGIGVRLAASMFEPEAWGQPGGYRIRGPIVAVTGEFRHNSDTDSGETFIEARVVELVEASRPMGDGRTPRSWPGPVGAALLILGVGLFALGRWRRARPRL